MNNKVRKMVGIGLFTAIVVVLQLLGGGIRFGVFSISLVLIPIVVGAAVYGWFAGAWLGFSFGMAVLLSGDAGAFMAVDPLATVLVVLVKGTLCGLCTGAIYTVVARRSRVIAVILAAIACPVVNTGIFSIGCLCFFMETIKSWGLGSGYTSGIAYLFLGMIGLNFVVELAVNFVLSPMIIRLIDLVVKKKISR